MDPVTAISLASSIITFIDFGTELITGAIEIYHAPDGTSAADAHLQDVLGDLSDLVEELEKSFHASTKAEKNIKRLARECGEDAKELQTILRGLKMTGRRTPWKSVKAKWMRMRAESDVEELRERLSESRADILLNLTLVLREEQSGIGQRLQQVSDSCKELKTDSAAGLGDLKISLLSAIKDQADALQGPLAGIKLLLMQLQSDAQRIPVEHRILRQLIFSEMDARRTQIHSADSTTCGWILENPGFQEPELTWAPYGWYGPNHRWPAKSIPKTDREEARHAFCTWLEKGQNVFHISGNAGCGKSTLVKYVARHEETEALLSTWAGDKTLVVADFYFWAGGSRLQATISGLQRSLLFEVLRSCRELMPKVFPLQWERFQSRAGDRLVESFDFSDDDIDHAFGVLLEHGVHANYRFCFFIDGLDEYKGNFVERRRLAQRLKDWTQGGDIKICVSSRPDREYLELFEYPGARIHLHQVNAPAIWTYCRRRFDESQVIQETDLLDWRKLEYDIVVMAQGVFLWAYLVVDILITAAHQGDPLHVIEKKLHETPKELDQLYDNMLGAASWGKIDRDRSNRILFLAAENPFSVPLTLIAFSWLDDLEDPDFPHIKMYQEDWAADLGSRLERAAKQIHALGRGLLELRKATYSQTEGPEVEFFHRSARDYLLQEKRRASMLRSLPDFEHFHPYGKILLARWIFWQQQHLKKSIGYQQDSGHPPQETKPSNGEKSSIQRFIRVRNSVSDTPKMYLDGYKPSHVSGRAPHLFLDDKGGVLYQVLLLSAPQASGIRLLRQINLVIEHYRDQPGVPMGQLHRSLHNQLREMDGPSASPGSLIHWAAWQMVTRHDEHYQQSLLKGYILEELVAQPHLKETIDGSLNLLVTLVWGLYCREFFFLNVDVDLVLSVVHSGVRLDGIMFVGKGSLPALNLYERSAEDTAISHEPVSSEDEQAGSDGAQEDAGQENTNLVASICQTWVVVLAGSVSTMLRYIILCNHPHYEKQGHVTIARELAQMTMEQGGDPHMKFHFKAWPLGRDVSDATSIDLSILEAISLCEIKFKSEVVEEKQPDALQSLLGLLTLAESDDKGRIEIYRIDLLSGTSKSQSIELRDLLFRVY
ncbi:hypothetical protein NM208_g2898 [Fusarium decemcellulare]|uniref:Uncharacterized protein n=1 Tax=Fusarium decemcellulare TaxID=57161 RepID=A0ACC1SQV1_9HYPO|nr:hypothetical protein NM208_g2898 [Fusarium decemcellulare]